MPSINWRPDAVAGVSVAGLLLPEAVAYAGIAGIEPQRAIVAGIIGCLVYPLLGRSRFAIVSPTSSSAAILAAILATFPGEATNKAMLATLAIALAAGLFLLASAARLGQLTAFIARPVLRGFAFGLAISIIVRQLPAIFGVAVPDAPLASFMVALVQALPSAHGLTTGLGVSALGALLLLRRYPLWPGAFLVLVAYALSAHWLKLEAAGVAVVGRISLAPLAFPMPQVDAATLSTLAQLTLPMVLILFAESWGTMRSLALRHGDTVMPDRELAALGLANLAAAALQGMPVGAGFSAGNANEAAGARSRGAGIIAALTLLLLVLFTTPLIAHLPKAVLAAVVIVALSHALDPGPLMRLFRLGRDGWIAVGAALCVLMLGVVDGMFIAIALSFAALLRRLANPHLARLGRLPGSHDFVEAGLHPEAELTPGIGVWRPGEPLFFGNAERALSAFVGVARASKAMRVAVLSLENTEDMDSTTLEALVECATRLRSARIKLILARVRDPIRALLRAEEADSLFAGVYYSVDDAVNAALNAMTEELAHET